MNRCLPRTVRRVVLIAALAMASRAPTRASESAPKTLDPTTYKSPSGAFTLTVDPSDIYGRYGGAYRVTKNGKELWSATLPFTFWQASVTDTGVVAGYAHTLGQRGFGETRDEPRPGDLIVAIIDPSGKIRLKQVTKRQESRYLHSPPDPLGHGLIVDEANDWLIVRVLNEGRDEIWWTYRLSTGAVLDKPAPHRSMPNAEPARWILDAKLIQGTPLVLLHWWRFDFQVGARFTLVDREAKPVWSLELPSDYMVKGSEAAQDKLQDWIREHGGILRTDQAHEFDLFFAAESKRVTFAVKQSPTGEWVVKETARAPFSIASPEDSKLAAIPKRSLKALGTLVLQANRAADDSPVRNVRDFVFDGKGRIAFLREDDDRTSFVLVDQTGKSVREIPLKMQPKADVSRWSGHCWVGGSRFVISLSEFGVDGKAQAWWVDAETGKVEPIPAFDCPSIERLVGATDGRFVALAILRSKYTLEKFVIGFDSQGRRQWSLKDDFNNKEPGSLFSVEGIALTTEGEIVVLENIVNTLKFFDRDGHFRRAIDLKQAWGRKPNYVAGITADVDGGFLVSDFHGSPPFVRMAHDGAVRGGFVPKHRDGRIIGTVYGTAAAADGHFWISDGHSLMRLNDAGVVERVLGESPKPAQLGRIAGITVDPQGRIYAIDSRTGSVHVFDSAGKLIHVCQTKPTDFKTEIWFPAITTNDKEDVYLGLGEQFYPDFKRPYAHFSADGRRLENVVLPAGECFFQPGSGVLVTLRYEDVRLIDPAGKLLRTINRRPDGNWLERPHAIALAPDGSMAILAGRSRGREVSANLYKANGDPIRTISLPEAVGTFPRIAYDGRRLVIAGDSGLLIFDGSARRSRVAISRSKCPRACTTIPTCSPAAASWQSSTANIRCCTGMNCRDNGRAIRRGELPRPALRCGLGYRIAPPWG